MNIDDIINLDFEDLKFLGDIAGMDLVRNERPEEDPTAPDADVDSILPPYMTDTLYDPEEIEAMVEYLARMAIFEGPEAFAEVVASHRKKIFAMAAYNPALASVVVIGYKLGVSNKSAWCANDLGTLYYMGELVPQDYERAAVLYEQAIQWGDYQSIINMGYIYEYGRIGEPDYAKAFEYFSLAVALNPQFESLYKLGDMFARGESVQRNMNYAYRLWEKSLDVAEGLYQAAQPAVRIAPLLLGEDESSGAPYDPMRALSLYQTAEIGLRQDIANGQTYYKKRLKEAIEGQTKAREIVEREG